MTPSGRVLLINNSGFGTYGPFVEANLKQTLEMMDVNMRGAVALTGRLLPVLCRRGGDIMNIASTAAFLPVVYSATYAASKAFLLHWSLALGEELRGSGVHVIAVCPGTTRTDFFRRAGFAEATLQGRFMQTAEEVVEEAMTALGARKTQVITGWKNRVMMNVVSKLPKPLATRIAARVLRRYWERQPK
jgi:short-subunit dehydrogenase